MQIISLFSKPIYKEKLKINTKKIVSLINNDFEKAGSKIKGIDVENITGVSKSFSVLEQKKFQNLKNQLMKEFYKYSYDILHYSNKFKITTSWFTKSEKNQSSNYHNHSNSMFSGILYLQTDENSGNISFQNFNDHRYKLNPLKYNIYNSVEYSFKPEDGLLILFPSEVYHKILKNNSNIIRHSLAFNLIPIGEIGNGDSYINVI
jgi:uncharacterized protein (TIGR02466 family)|tara:strand:+ start:61 stop:675 length:615 start_codon:yes stop_codon:yes gene_type:complete